MFPINVISKYKSHPDKYLKEFVVPACINLGSMSSTAVFAVAIYNIGLMPWILISGYNLSDLITRNCSPSAKGLSERIVDGVESGLKYFLGSKPKATALV